MSAGFIFSILIGYFMVLIGISYITSRGADNQSFYLANKKSPWFLVAFGMIGASLSGITFISIPGWPGITNEAGEYTAQFGYMQMVFGYLVGYLVIAYVLMPIYYRMNVTSIYTYLKDRFGPNSHKIGAVYFLVSRVLGASIRLLLVSNVLQRYVFDEYNIPFEVTVLISILLIWVYTFKGGLKTIIWTDTLQTLFMLLSLGFTFWFLSKELNLSETGGAIETIKNSQFSQIFFFEDINNKNHFLKMFFGGIFIAIGMTGLDQDMMQKNLSCKNIKSAQTNMVSFSIVLVFINLVFLALGALLYMYAAQEGITVPFKEITNELGVIIDTKPQRDLLFPEIALKSNIGMGVGILFLLGLIAAAYSSADSALTSLTTSVCVDFIDTEEEKTSKKKRQLIHVIMSAVLLITVIILHATLDDSAIWQLIWLAGFTYGPLIGMFFFGIFTKRNVNDNLTIIVCVISPILTYVIDYLSKSELGFNFGGSLIIVNSILTFIGLLLISDGTTQD